MAIDTEGNVIIVAKAHRYKLETREKANIYLIIQFREVPAGPHQPADSGQPTRILEAYRFQERDKLPDEPYLELARIDYDPSDPTVKNAKNQLEPKKNEIDLRFRIEAAPGLPQVVAEPPSIEPSPPVPSEKPSASEEKASARLETLNVGHVVLGEASKGLHIAGLKSLVKEINLMYGIDASIKENLSLGDDFRQCKLLYITGNTGFDMTENQQEALGAFLASGGIVFGEGCSDGQDEAGNKGAKQFGLSFNQLASNLQCKLENVQRGHPLLSAAHMFSSVPDGAESGMILAGGRMIYSACDYGCAWQGGRAEQPLPRESIRSSIEIATNIIKYE
jgi:hypothetical protein